MFANRLRIQRFLVTLSLAIPQAASADSPAAVQPPSTSAAAGVSIASAQQAKCQAIVATTDAAKLPKGVSGLLLSKPSRCFEAAGTTYALLPVSYSQLAPESKDYYKLVWQLAKINPADAATPFSEVPVSAIAPKTAASRAIPKTHPAMRPLTDAVQAGDDSSTFYIERIADLNGDGKPEVFVVTNYNRYEVAAEQLLEIWTVQSSGKGSQLVPYQAAPVVPALTIQQLEKQKLLVDVDGDGRIDIHTDGPYHGVTECFSGSSENVPIVPAWFLLHATPNGTFSASDLIAKQELARTCNIRPILKQPYSKTRDFLKEVVCARVFGQSKQQVLAELAPHCAAIAQDAGDMANCGNHASNGCPTWLVEAAAVTPPITLP